MKLIGIAVIVISSLLCIKAQDAEMQLKLDSILEEGKLLYNYEKAIWKASDIVMQEKSRDYARHYIVYDEGESMTVVFSDNEFKNQVAKFEYLKYQFEKPLSKDYTEKELEPKDAQSFALKNKALDNINAKSSEYEFHFFPDYNPNIVWMPAGDGYKLYIIIGTPIENVIPFGNDYLFRIDNEGKVSYWHKFHQTQIMSQTKLGDEGEGKTIVSLMHSHLKMTPYISATDICTFLLYGYELAGLNLLSVYSTAFEKTFTYDVEKDTITVGEL